jgi:hypothetical protein
VIKLGSKVRDVISGYEGIAVARNQHLNGCIGICIEGPLARDDKGVVRRDDLWVDEQRVAVIEVGAYQHQGDYAGELPGPAARTGPAARIVDAFDLVVQRLRVKERELADGRRLATAGGPGIPTPPRDGR